ncbi:Clan CA, family C1, cathepsin H-like cysteine peptidase [Tritrichomonas foetus]|uniref:Clan CA, family C1, cathepsin H-like cysteine peptidase n=1 Tax=Tritrichomonas foetus TaxID=1144522 RepID=A0A1J4JQB8_9EUKA|nr:Clan CA, family C1, cathepsin H-like cysteine peptidase [Tritrichomonas foetus]|eukprot:OHT01313.1 Clan CA, family C1, cathepsin H-like cysteine peptidase [Tritrichomonas foetus]
MLPLNFFLTFAFSNPLPIFAWPPRYTIKGTWNVPYANLSSPILIVHEPHRQYTNKYNGVEQQWTTTADEHFHRKIVGAGDKYICYGYSKTAANWDLSIVKYLPDTEGYSAQEGTYAYRGHSCNLYTKNLGIQNWQLYTDNETGYPVGFVMGQAKSVSGSHYDKYVLNIDEFIPEVLPGVWTLPSLCTNPSVLPDDPYPFNLMSLYFDDGSSSNQFIESLPYSLRSNTSASTSYTNIIEDNTATYSIYQKHFQNFDSKKWLHTIANKQMNRIIRQENKEKLGLSSRQDMEDICKTREETAKLLTEQVDDVEFSWRDQVNPRIVAPVRDQCSCGSCWAFGTAELLEGAFALASKKDVELISANQFMDCTWEGDNFGCQGGDVNWAFTVMKNKSLAIAYEKDYPYMGVSGLCEKRYKEPAEGMRIAGYIDECFHIPRTNQMVKRALKKWGPLSLGINVVESMMMYTGGVVNDTKCVGTARDLVHAVLLTGWRVIDGVEVWEIKNSWSTYWGDEGYLYIQAVHPEWNCGVTTNAHAVTVIPANRN